MFQQYSALQITLFAFAFDSFPLIRSFFLFALPLSIYSFSLIRYSLCLYSPIGVFFKPLLFCLLFVHGFFIFYLSFSNSCYSVSVRFSYLWFYLLYPFLSFAWRKQWSSSILALISCSCSTGYWKTCHNWINNIFPISM